MSTTLSIGGSSVSIPSDVILNKFQPFAKGSFPTLTFSARGGALAGLPDPYLGKEAILAIGGTTYFKGDVISGPHCTFNNQYGWLRTYQCAGLRDRLDQFPHTDSNTGTSSSSFNLHPEDPSYIGSRAGRTLGQILTECLTMTDNATTANSLGVGNYASLGPPAVLSTQTLADLAPLQVIPPAPTYFASERLGTAIESILSQWAPNILFWIDPATGDYRFSDLRKFTAHTFTLDTDPIEPTPLSRILSHCFSRVKVRGGPLVNGILLDTLGGGLVEDFAHDALSSAAAKAAWSVADFQNPTLASAKSADNGTCTCPSTTTVTVTSSNGASTWTSNFWDQGSGRHGIVYLTYGAGSGITQYTTRRIISNTSLSAGGTSTLTLDLPLAITSYTAYQIYGLSGGASIVWRQYAIANATVGAALANQFSFPQPYRLAANNGAMLTSFPIGSVVATGGSEVSAWFTSDPSTGKILFSQPTYIVAGSTTPTNVRALVAVNQGPQAAVWPPDAYAPGTLTTGAVTGHGTIVPGSGFTGSATCYVIGDGTGATATATITSGAISAISITAGGSGYTWAIIAVFDSAGTAALQYGGTSHTVEAQQGTLTVTIGAWRDPGNYAGMLAYAYDLFQSVCDTVVEGSVRYLGLYTNALTPGLAVNITGSTFTTGWESPLTSFTGFGGLPVTSVEVEWPMNDGPDQVTTMHVGNHRSQAGQSTFLRPNRQGMTITGGFQGHGGLLGGGTAPNLPSGGSGGGFDSSNSLPGDVGYGSP